MELKGKSIVLTGGSSGVGLALLELLVQQGNRVAVLASRNTLAEELSHYGAQVISCRCNLESPEEIKAAIRKLKELLGGIDVLINNAAIQENVVFDDENYNENRILREVAINFTAPALLMHYLLRDLKASKQGFVVNVNSGLALAPKKTSSVYCATKAGLACLTRSLRYQNEGGTLNFVNAYLPLVDTPMTSGRGSGKISPEEAAMKILIGIEADRKEIYVGKVKLLAILIRIVPSIAYGLMKRN